jgi:hypothetical protein
MVNQPPWLLMEIHSTQLAAAVVVATLEMLALQVVLVVAVHLTTQVELR